MGSGLINRRSAAGPRERGCRRAVEGVAEVSLGTDAERVAGAASTSARSSARTSRFSASASAASCSSRICSPTSSGSLRGKTHRRAARAARDALPPCRSDASTASCAGTIFDFLDKASAQALAQQIVRMLRPGGAVMGFFCTSAVRRSGFHEIRNRRRDPAAASSQPGDGGRQRRHSRTATSSDVRRPHRVGFVPAEEQHPGDALCAGAENILSCAPSSRC